ncbi:MAG: ester cyclase [Thermomicrobiales bacterium]
MGPATAIRWVGIAATAFALVMPMTAAAQDATPAPSCPALDDATMATMAKGWTDHSFDPADDPAFDATLAPNLLYHSAAFGDVDAAGWLAGRKKLAASFPDAAITVNQTIVDAPWAVTQWTARGTFSGAPFLDAPATGQPVGWDGINIYRFDCGKIAEAWTQIDQYGRLDAVVPTEPAATPAPACADPAAEISDADAQTILTRWWNEGWNGPDAEAIADITAPDVLHHWAMGADTTGDAAIAERVASWKTSMPDLTITPAEILTDGNLAAARWIADGTDTGGIMGAAPTGKHATWGGINLFRIQCGEITEVWSEMDAMSMAAQLSGK